jgi:hypothetical protein
VIVHLRKAAPGEPMVDEADSDERLFQVAFDLPRESATWPPVDSEPLWAAKTEVKLHLAVRNVPFYAKGVAYGDVVLVRPDNDRREFVFERLVSESGHSAIQVLIHEAEYRGALKRLLSGFGATWEGALEDTYFAVDVKPATDYAALRSELVAAKEHGKIGVRESAISKQHRGPDAFVPVTSSSPVRLVAARCAR